MNPCRLLLATVLAALVATLSACGGHDIPATLATPTPSAPAPATKAPTPATPATPVAEDRAGLSREWKATIVALLATDTTAAQKAAAVSGGDDLVPTLRRLAGAVAGLTIHVEVTHPVVTGTRGRADIVVTSGGRTADRTYPAFFDRAGGAWRITRAGACSLISLSGVRCPDRG